MLRQRNNLGGLVSVGDPAHLADMVRSMMATAHPFAHKASQGMSQNRVENADGVGERLPKPVPQATYRMLEQGGISGWRLELDLDGQMVTLCSDAGGAEGRYAAFCDRTLADRLARQQIADRYGDEAARIATFSVTRGGSL